MLQEIASVAAPDRVPTSDKVFFGNLTRDLRPKSGYIEYEFFLIPAMTVGEDLKLHPIEHAIPFCGQQRENWLKTSTDLANASVSKELSTYSIELWDMIPGLYDNGGKTLQSFRLNDTGRNIVCFKLIGEHTGIKVPSLEAMNTIDFSREVEVTLCTHPITGYRKDVDGQNELASMKKRALRDPDYQTMFANACALEVTTMLLDGPTAFNIFTHAHTNL